MESDRVWPRRTARHSVAFSCSPRRLELGGRRCGGCTTEHMPTPPNQGCPRATLAPNRPPALHNCPASGPVQLRFTKNAVGGRCLGASWSQTGTDSGYLCVLCPWPTCTLPCTSPELHFDHHSRRNSLNPTLFKEILNYAQNM